MEFLSPLSIEELTEKFKDLEVLGQREEYPEYDKMFNGCELHRAMQTINYSHLYTGDIYRDY